MKAAKKSDPDGQTYTWSGTHAENCSISFLLHKLPFVQGITSARDIGDVISAAILESEAEGELSAA